MTDPRSAQEMVLPRIVSILVRTLGQRRCEVYLFGSRASGEASTASDFDIGVSADEEIGRELSIAREMFESSNIPYMIDLVGLRNAVGGGR